MKVVYLVGGDSLSPEQCESYVSEGASLRGSGGPVLALHNTIIGGWTAECDSIPLVIGADPHESTASGHLPFEMVNVRRFEVWAGRLIVAAVLVKQGIG